MSDYAALAKRVRAAGIRTVTGKLVVDATYFDSVRYNPTWRTGYADDYYAAEISALTLAPNADYDSGTVIIKYQAGSVGKKAKITTSPAAAASYLSLKNLTTTGKKGTSTSFSASRAQGAKTITLRGRVPKGRSGSRLITVNRPDLYAAAVFRAELKKAGVTVRGGTTSLATPATKRTVLATDYSMPLSQLLVPFLKLSNNMHAEALTKAMGAKRSGAPGTWSNGLAATRAYLTAPQGADERGVAVGRIRSDPGQHAHPTGPRHPAGERPEGAMVPRLQDGAAGGRQHLSNGRRHAAAPDERHPGREPRLGEDRHPHRASPPSAATSRAGTDACTRSRCSASTPAAPRGRWRTSWWSPWPAGGGSPPAALTSVGGGGRR